MNDENLKEEIKIFDAQDEQYDFPYHHIPKIDKEDIANRVKILDWGFDYLACKYYAIKTIESYKPNSILEVGCGDGSIIGSLNPLIKRKVGVDLSERAISFAKAFHPEVDFICDDVKNVEERFDAILLIEVLEHIPNNKVDSFINEVFKKLNKGGVIYISVPSVNLPLYKKHYRHYSPDLLIAQIQDANLDLEIELCRYFRSPVRFENFYKRLTCNRLFVGEIHPLRKYIWKNIRGSLDSYNHKTAQHVIAIIRK